MRQRIVVGVVVAAVLIGGGIWAEAQNRVLPGPPSLSNPPQEVISGADIGFRVDTWDGDTPVGRIVVRHDGQWVDVRIPVTPRRLRAR